jgi:hypothetical protein
MHHLEALCPLAPVEPLAPGLHAQPVPFPILPVTLVETPAETIRLCYDFQTVLCIYSKSLEKMSVIKITNIQASFLYNIEMLKSSLL